MLTSARQRGFTEEQLMSLPHLGKAELIDGRIIMTPAGAEHGNLGMYLGGKMEAHVRERRLGRVFDSSTGFRMENGDVLSPDVGFVAADRLRGLKRLPRGYFDGSPELVVEVLSPHDPPAELERKIAEYFRNGTQRVWVVDPAGRTVRLHRGGEPDRTLHLGDILDGEGVVPGFRLSLDDLFAAPDFE